MTQTGLSIRHQGVKLSAKVPKLFSALYFLSLTLKMKHSSISPFAFIAFMEEEDNDPSEGMLRTLLK